MEDASGRSIFKFKVGAREHRERTRRGYGTKGYFSRGYGIKRKAYNETLRRHSTPGGVLVLLARLNF